MELEAVLFVKWLLAQDPGSTDYLFPQDLGSIGSTNNLFPQDPGSTGSTYNLFLQDPGSIRFTDNLFHQDPGSIGSPDNLFPKDPGSSDKISQQDPEYNRMLDPTDPGLDPGPCLNTSAWNWKQFCLSNGYWPLITTKC